MNIKCILCEVGTGDDYENNAREEYEDNIEAKYNYDDGEVMGNTDYTAATVLSTGGKSPTSTVFQQSVTLTVKMQENGTSPGVWKFGSWLIPSQHFPILIAIFIGGIIVMLFIFALILWKCCISPYKKKDYGVKMAEEEGPHLEQQNNHVVSVLPNHSAVFLDPKSGQLLICANRILNPRPGDLISSHWICTNAVPRSWSAPINEAQSLPTEIDSSHRSPATINEHCAVPPISEFNPQVSSSIALNEVTSSVEKDKLESSELKCRSLPSTIRPKKLNSSSSPITDNSSELYAKVNFSKKKRNRMRNNEAAIIALSKSRSEFFHNKDTDSLVDNEAVIVYDERTAL